MDWWAIISNTLRAGISASAIIYALAAIGLNLHFGYTGLLNFGQVGFMAAGAYGLGITTYTYGWPLWAGILAGLGAGVLLGVLLGAPTLRLRADYLAIVTIAAGEIIRIIVRAAVLRDVTGGSNGLNGFANEFQEWNFFDPSREYGGRVFGKLNLEYTGADLWEMIIGWSLVGLCVLIMWLLVSSPWGRVLKSIREDEDAARALGKNVFRFKMQSLILGGTFGTIAGMFFALSNNSVQPDNYSTPVTFFALTAAIMGGLGRVGGPVIGSMIFWAILAFTDNILRQAVGEDYIPDSLMDSVQIGQMRFILVGLLLIALMVFRPQGIFGDKREIAIDVRK
jgi:neutral amino acid transport system permease protein